jgi:hypothetical protein
MLKKSFTLASAVSLTGAVVWLTSASACGGDEETPKATTSSSSSSSGEATSSSSSSSSSGSTSDDDAGLTDPNTVEGVEVTYGDCEAFTKCDGSIEGSWAITGGCLDKTTFDDLRKQSMCDGIKEHDVVIKASGTVTATKTDVTQKTSLFLSAKIDVPKSCPSVQFVLASSGGCAGLNQLLTSGAAGGATFNHAQCVDAGDNCACAADATVTEPGVAADPYTTDGAGTLTTTPKNGDPRTYEYCPKSDKITYRETTKDNKSFGMYLTITKQ